MHTATPWPADDELRQLLRGALDSQRQAEIERLLDQDEALRQRLEAIAGGNHWIGRAPPPTGDEAGPDAALEAAMRRLKDQANGATLATDSAQPSMALGFL